MNGVSTPNGAPTIIGWVRIIAMIAAIGWTAWSGFKPGGGDSQKWYDRAIRAIGGLLILLVLLAGLILELTESHSR